MTMKAKKLPRTHSKMVARINKTGPVKKNVPLMLDYKAKEIRNAIKCGSSIPSHANH